MKALDVAGMRFQKLVGLRRADNIGRATAWLFRCDCGVEKIINLASVTHGRVVSCGCYLAKRRAESHTVHGACIGGRFAPEYNPWASAKARCNNPDDAAYPLYGARGIKMAPEWGRSFAQFRKDMGPRPPNTSLDRIDNDRGYEPGNCRWATRVQQQRNKRNTRYVDCDGTRISLAEYAERKAVPYRRLWAVMSERGLDHVRAAEYLQARLADVTA